MQRFVKMAGNTTRSATWQTLATMIEYVERRYVGYCLPRFGLQVDGRTNLLEITDNLQQTIDD